MHASPLSPDLSALPDIPKNFGNPNVLPRDNWGMLANDKCGDCGIAGPMHIEMCWDVSNTFTASDAVSDYGAISGYPRHDPGTNMMVVGSYWQNTGLRSSKFWRHKIAAYRSIQGSNAGQPNLDHVTMCTYLFGAVGIGIICPDSVTKQFYEHRIWEPVDGAKDTKEFHFVAVVCRQDDLLGIVSWGRLCWMTQSFFTTYCKEATAYLRNASDSHAVLFKRAA
jgi:hypothetical protein